MKFELERRGKHKLVRELGRNCNNAIVWIKLETTNGNSEYVACYKCEKGRCWWCLNLQRRNTPRFQSGMGRMRLKMVFVASAHRQIEITSFSAITETFWILNDIFPHLIHSFLVVPFHTMSWTQKNSENKCHSILWLLEIGYLYKRKLEWWNHREWIKRVPVEVK